MSENFADAESVMRRAIQLAERGIGFVEPNPPVGAVIVDERFDALGDGYHERFGGPHAEVNAIARAGDRARGGALFVTLEPCCRTGKTGPCTRAVINAGIRRVVVAVRDPSLDGGGLAELAAAGIAVDVGLLEDEAARLTAPFFKRVTTGMPYVHAKWAMTLDGKIATHTGESQWISNAVSREVAHRLRGRMDAILVGSVTARRDDPHLIARPAGPRVATRIVIDSQAGLPLESQLVRTVEQAPVIVAAGESADETNVRHLQSRGVEVLRLPQAGVPAGNAAAGDCRVPDLTALFSELGRRGMTNVLVEGGGRLLGSIFDQRLVDEIHVFAAGKVVGGAAAPSPVAGVGLEHIADAWQLDRPQIEVLDGDVYIHGPLRQVRL